MRFRTGVLNSQYAGESGEVVELTKAELTAKLAETTFAMHRNRQLDILPRGAVVDIEQDPEGEVLITEVVERLVPGKPLYDEWRCHCSGAGCVDCNHTGFASGDDRFVQELGERNEAYLCLTRYLTPETEFYEAAS
jgi:hypothetical protein